MNKVKYMILAMVLLIGAVSVVLVFGRPSPLAKPSITNFKPSGYSIAAELLRRQGYTVTQELDPYKQLDPKALIVLVTIESESFISPIAEAEMDANVSAALGSLQSFEKKGGRWLELFMDEDFQQASRKETEPTKIRFVGKQGQEFQVSGVHETTAPLETVYPIAVDGSNAVIGGYNVKDAFLGIMAVNGIAFTNRYIDEYDNANLFVQLVKLSAQDRQHIIFFEPSWGNASPPSVLEVIGPWSIAMFWQLLLLLLVIAWTLAPRFGLIQSDPVKQRGTKDILEAMGLFLRRGKKHDQALEILLEDAHERIRRMTRSPVGTSETELHKLASPGLQKAIYAIRSSKGHTEKSIEYIKMARNLESELQAFESELRSRTSLLIKS